MAYAACPECEHRVKISASKMGLKLSCPECEAELSVVNLRPLELDWVDADDFDDDDEEWDDEDEDFDDD